METEIDPDTNLPHIAPIGLEHHERRKKGTGRYYADCKIPHWIIKLHQEAFPELERQMGLNSDPTRVYSAFLSSVPLRTAGRLTPEEEKKILKIFGLV